MVATLERETGWRRATARSRCGSTASSRSHVNRSFLRPPGLTVHGLIANNLIIDGVRSKRISQGRAHYDEAIADRLREVERRLERLP